MPDEGRNLEVFAASDLENVAGDSEAHRFGHLAGAVIGLRHVDRVDAVKAERGVGDDHVGLRETGGDDRAAAAWILLGLGATDWVDGWVARRFNQVSEFGKMFDPTADRLLFIVGLVAIMIDGSAPLWFCLLVIAREVLFGGTVAILTLFFKMERFDVTYLGKWATFLLMGVFPAFVMSASEIRFHEFFGAAAWIAGPIGLALSYYTAWLYVPTIRASLKKNR